MKPYRDNNTVVILVHAIARDAHGIFPLYLCFVYGILTLLRLDFNPHFIYSCVYEYVYTLL